MKIVTKEGKRFVYFNTWHMKGLTFEDFMKDNELLPKHGKDTPVRKKFKQIEGCHYYLIEIV